MSSLSESQAIIVLGMHRSGTSAVTGVLSQFGVDLGERLYAPQSGVNEKGFFEHSDIADTNDDVLFSLGSSWDDILPLDNEWWLSTSLDLYRNRLERYIRRDFGNSKLWGLKDPRICRLLPFWVDLLTRNMITTKYLLSIRHPGEVAKSLERRDRFSRQKSLMLWLSYNLDAEYWSRNLRREVLLFDDLLNHPGDQIARIGRSMEVNFPVDIIRAGQDSKSFLSPGLRHQVERDVKITGNESALDRWCLTIYQECLRAGKSEGASLDEQLFDSINVEFSSYIKSFPSVLVEHFRSSSLERGRLNILVNRIFRSKSWVFGKPLRYIERIFGGDI